MNIGSRDNAAAPFSLPYQPVICLGASFTNGGDAYDGGVRDGGDGRDHDDHRSDGDDDRNDGSEVARNSDGGVDSDDDDHGYADGNNHGHSHRSGSERMQA